MATQQAPRLDPHFAQLLDHLHRGGAAGYFWRKGAGSTWWPTHRPPAQLPAQADVYFGVHPATAPGGPGQRSTLATVAAINALFAEFDAKDFADGKPDALDHIQRLDPAPSVCVDSGGGYHCYWLLDRPYLLDDEAARERARGLQARWVAYVAGDPGAKDLTRVLRAPGTRNGKYDPARPVAFAWCDLAEIYDLGELAAALPPEPAQPPAPAPRPSAAPGDRRTAYAQKALGEEVARVAMAGRGTRNDALNNAAFTLGRKVAAGLIDEHQVEQSLLGAAAAAGLPSGEARATVASGLKAGIAEGPPSTLPDFDAPAHDVCAQTSSTSLSEECHGRGTPSEQADGERFNRTDLGNARRLVAQFGERIRYVHTWGAWLIYDGTRWVKDETGEINRLARQTVRTIYAEAARTEDSAARKDLARWATASESAGKLKAIVDLAESEPGIAVHHTELDAEPWLLNCLNGTIDLRDGQLRPHRREDLLTKRIDIAYDPAAAAPTWARFLERITEGDAELSAYMARAAGYTLTGSTSEQCLFFCYGSGANGKTTFIEALGELLGGYWQKAPTEMIMLQKFGGGIPNDLARLPGARMVVTGELSQGRKLDESKVKDITGGDTITARFMREEFFDFKPIFKLWMFGNHKPQIRGDDYGIWRRIRLIPFNATISDAEKDTALPMKLRAEQAGILAWAVRGCLDWQAGGLRTPEAVTTATAAYRAEMDTVGGFIDECCVLRESARTLATPLYEAYVDWCDANGERAMSKRDFWQRLDARGLLSKRTNKGFYRHGVGLLSADQLPLDDSTGDQASDPVIRGDPTSQMTKTPQTLMGHVENRITSDHRITDASGEPDLAAEVAPVVRNPAAGDVSPVPPPPPLSDAERRRIARSLARTQEAYGAD